jgi:hypothetical protein
LSGESRSTFPPNLREREKFLREREKETESQREEEEVRRGKRPGEC